MKRYPIYQDEIETWDLVLDREANCTIDRSTRPNQSRPQSRNQSSIGTTPLPGR
jgi:hypothetical protein